MVDEKQVMISVIIPVYNSEKYLHKCIDSVLSQSYQDFELILVNDGSKDSSGDICDEYAKKDERVRVFHQDNAGVSAARNKGLDNSTGKWVVFIDSDDSVGGGYLQNLYGVAFDTGCDLVISNLKSIYSNSTLNNKMFNLKELKTDSSFLPDELELDGNFILGNNPVSKLFRLNLIRDNNLRFNKELRMGEDFIFVLQYALKVKHIQFINEFDYNYNRINESSATLKYHPSLYDDLILLKQAYFTIVSAYKVVSEEEKLYQYFRVASKVVFQEGSLSYNKSFRERKKSIENILNKEEVRQFRKKYKLEESSFGFFEIIRKMMKLNQPFLITMFLTVYFKMKN